MWTKIYWLDRLTDMNTLRQLNRQKHKLNWNIDRHGEIKEKQKKERQVEKERLRKKDKEQQADKEVRNKEKQAER